jgi:NADH-quinone oxidoreductase subunit K
MDSQYIDHAIILAGILFCLGLVGVMVRRNLLFIMISIEVMLNAAGFAFIAECSAWDQAEGQVMFLAVITLGAAEVAVGLGLTLLLFRHHNSVNVDQLNQLRG